jgi:hypothetical protein
MSQPERRQLAKLLAELDEPDPGDPGNPVPGRAYPNDPNDLHDQFLHDPALRRERRLALPILAVCCVILAAWIVVLAATLPHHFDAHHWRAVWVNFDLFLLAAFAATAWATWRERQVLILLLVGTGTMLCCDAWFDVGTSLATSGVGMSVASAIFAELPLAFLAFAGARRLLKATVGASADVPAAARDQSPAGRRRPDGASRWPGPSLRRTPLACGLEEALPRRRAR